MGAVVADLGVQPVVEGGAGEVPAGERGGLLAQVSAYQPELGGVAGPVGDDVLDARSLVGRNRLEEPGEPFPSRLGEVLASSPWRTAVSSPRARKTNSW
jgi:hypothetical protein